MKCQDVITVVISHIFQNRLRAGLSILGICIGIGSVLCMMAIGDGAKKIIADDIEKLGGFNQIRFWTRTSIWKNGRMVRHTTERYTFEDVYRIEAECPNVLFVLPKSDRMQGQITNRHGSRAYLYVEGVTADYARGMRWKVQDGRFFTQNEIDTAGQVCILGAESAKELFGSSSALSSELKIKFQGSSTPVRCRIVGIMAPKGRSLRIPYSMDEMVFVPITTYLQRLSGDRYMYGFTVFFEKDADITRIIASIKDILRKGYRGKDDFIGYWIPNNNIREFDRIEKIIKIALGGIAGFSLFVSGIGIMNICLVSVGEKTREIGLRKAVGAKRIDIFYQFLTESICLCLSGGVLGITGGWLAAHGMARVAVRIVPIVDVWPVVLSGQWIVISVLFSIFMGIIFGVYPALRAARMTPIDALRTDI